MQAEERTSAPRVAVVVLNYRNKVDTVTCVQSVLGSECTSFRIVVVDNNSGDDCLNHVRTALTGHPRASWVEYVQSPDNRGYGPGNNVGIRHVLASGSADYFWILNNDVLVEPAAMGHLLCAMDAREDVGIAGATILEPSPEGPVVQALGGSRLHPWTLVSSHIGHGLSAQDLPAVDGVEAQLDFVSGACMFVRRRFIDTVGLMAEDYFLYFEEADWMARNAGRFGVMYVPQAVVTHQEGASIGSSSKAGQASPFSVYWIIRSRLKFARRHRPQVLPVVLWRMAKYWLSTKVRGQSEVARAIARGVLGVQFR